MRIIKYEDRNCDLCGGRDLEEIWKYSIKSRTRNDITQWKVRNVICRNCGFAFVSPSPTQKSLESHYADSFELFAGQRPDYSIEKRIALIKKYCIKRRNTTYLEIGSNNCPEFMSELKKVTGKISTMEINQNCNSSYKDADEIPRKFADVVAAYFVFEHVPDIKRLIRACAKAMSDSGVLIAEVPDLTIYARDPAGLYLCEHVNHFSPYTLSTAAGLCGLELVEFSRRRCSRPFGFVSVFRKSRRALAKAGKNNDEYIISREAMLEGVETMKNLSRKIDAARKRIREMAESGKSSIIWSANWNCMRLLDGFKLPETAFVVDSDIRKKDYFKDTQVSLPSEKLKEIGKASYLVLNAPFYADEIKNWISDKTGRKFTNEDSIILDYF